LSDKITIIGRIGFNPEDVSKKHNLQSSWKRIAMVYFDGDLSSYYAWFINRRYNLSLNQPLRGAHISFINDSIRDLSNNGKKTIEEVNYLWNNAKTKWDGKNISVTFSLEPNTNGKTWWFNLSIETTELLNGIRSELGLGKPYFNFHMSIGYANHKNIEHSEYLHRLIESNFFKDSIK